jgi:hypothetical protein
MAKSQPKETGKPKKPALDVGQQGVEMPIDPPRYRCAIRYDWAAPACPEEIRLGHYWPPRPTAEKIDKLLKEVRSEEKGEELLAELLLDVDPMWRGTASEFWASAKARDCPYREYYGLAKNKVAICALDTLAHEIHLELSVAEPWMLLASGREDGDVLSWHALAAHVLFTVDGFRKAWCKLASGREDGDVHLFTPAPR